MTRRRADPAQAQAVTVAGYVISVRSGRIWLHRTADRDGDLTAAAAEALAAALQGAALQAKRRGRPGR